MHFKIFFFLMKDDFVILSRKCKERFILILKVNCIYIFFLLIYLIYFRTYQLITLLVFFKKIL